MVGNRNNFFSKLSARPSYHSATVGLVRRSTGHSVRYSCFSHSRVRREYLSL